MCVSKFFFFFFFFYNFLPLFIFLKFYENDREYYIFSLVFLNHEYIHIVLQLYAWKTRYFSLLSFRYPINGFNQSLNILFPESAVFIKFFYHSEFLWLDWNWWLCMIIVVLTKNNLETSALNKFIWLRYSLYLYHFHGDNQPQWWTKL